MVCLSVVPLLVSYNWKRVHLTVKFFTGEGMKILFMVAAFMSMTVIAQAEEICAVKAESTVSRDLPDLFLADMDRDVFQVYLAHKRVYIVPYKTTKTFRVVKVNYEKDYNLLQPLGRNTESLIFWTHIRNLECSSADK